MQHIPTFKEMRTFPLNQNQNFRLEKASDCCQYTP
jgi:hypothetical protein